MKKKGKKRKKKPSMTSGFCSFMPGRSYQIPAAQFLPHESFVFILAMNSEAQILLKSFYTYCRVFRDKMTLCYIRNVFSYSSCACYSSVCPIHLYNRTKHIISPAQLCFMLTVSLYWQCLGGKWQGIKAPSWKSHQTFVQLLHYSTLAMKWRTAR